MNCVKKRQPFKTCDSSIFSTIAKMRFPLMVGIVCIHSDIRIVVPQLESLPVFNTFMTLFKNYYCFPAVDVFFIISGYLFFVNLENFDLKCYRDKLSRRIKSLMMPYLLWNGSTFICIAFCQFIHPGFNLFLKKQIIEFHWYDYFMIFWDKQMVTGFTDDPHGPLLLQFWFIQCLFVAQLFAPVVWIALKHLKYVFVVVLLLIYTLVDFPDIAGFKTEAFFFFTVGACIATSRLRGLYNKPAAWFFLCILTAVISHYIPMAHAIYSLTFCMLILSMSKRKTFLGRLIPSPSEGAVFFLFAFHIFVSGGMGHAVKILRVNWNECMAFAAFLLIVACNVGICLLIYSLLSRQWPSLTRILTGTRSSR